MAIISCRIFFFVSSKNILESLQKPDDIAVSDEINYSYKIFNEITVHTSTKSEKYFYILVKFDLAINMDLYF